MIRSILTRLLAYLAIAYTTAIACLYFWQDRLLFPVREAFGKASPMDDSAKFEDLQISVNTRDHLHAWWIPAAEPTGKVLLVFHGNGYALEDMVGDELPKLRESGANLLLVDYRGYGSSTRISPHETTVNEDAEAAFDYLVRSRSLLGRIAMDNVFVLGRSIGSGPATYLARRHQGLGGLILESPFSSIEDAAANFWCFRIFPLEQILRTHFDNLSAISSVRAPVLIVSGTADTLTPSWMAEKILARANEPKQLYLVQGAGHDDLLSVGGRALADVLRKFIQEDRR
jgi:pimeloyl-ACP methyl ester carboxylesterase